MRTLSKASVQEWSVIGSIWFKRAVEHEICSDMVEKAVKEVGRLRVWCRRDWFFWRLVEGAPTM